MNPELWRKVEELFRAALERAPEARQTFLDRKCGGDLRQEVELLLAKEKQAGSFLEIPALEDVAVTLTSVGCVSSKLGAHLNSTTYKEAV
jgi:hypothetical protein